MLTLLFLVVLFLSVGHAVSGNEIFKKDNERTSTESRLMAYFLGAQIGVGLYGIVYANLYL